MTIKNVRLKNQSGDQLIPDVGIPSQSGNNGKVLGTNGSNLVWVTQQGGGGSSAVWTYDTMTETLNISNSTTEWTYNSGTETLTIG